jgi:hypothetical protein
MKAIDDNAMEQQNLGEMIRTECLEPFSYERLDHANVVNLESVMSQFVISLFSHVMPPYEQYW